MATSSSLSTSGGNHVGAGSDHLSTKRSSNTFHQFLTQAQIMEQLGISNGEVRPSTRHSNRNDRSGGNAAATTSSSGINQRRRRQRYPARRSEPRPSSLYPVKAMHIAQTIDIDRVMQQVLCNNTEKRKLFGKNSLVVELEAPPGSAASAPPRFVSVFRFGSVVFLNMPDKEAVALTERIRQLSTDTVEPGQERREHFGILVQPDDDESNGTSDLYRYHRHEQQQHPTNNNAIVMDLPPEQIVTGDYCIVREIDLNGVAVISNILAQTVALDSYNDTVDRLLSQFAAINSNVRGSGHFKHSDKNFLFKTVAQNNAIFIDMISKIRLKDRSETAWTMTKYETIHYGLKAEFEIDDRFDQIEFKLNLIQQNAKFFLEVLQHQKSNTLEWIIVVLIGVECVIMCIDMSGMGETFFKYLGMI